MATCVAPLFGQDSCSCYRDTVDDLQRALNVHFAASVLCCHFDVVITNCNDSGLETGTLTSLAHDNFMPLSLTFQPDADTYQTSKRRTSSHSDVPTVLLIKSSIPPDGPSEMGMHDALQHRQAERRVTSPTSSIPDPKLGYIRPGNRYPKMTTRIVTASMLWLSWLFLGVHPLVCCHTEPMNLLKWRGCSAWLS